MTSLNVPALAPVSTEELHRVEGGRFIFRRICVRFRIIRIFVRDRFPFPIPFRGGNNNNNNDNNGPN